ncbi:protein of unknown function [Actinacidiphila yanglinensis]|uniref:DUF5133 domain-containing protein n=1 Tax=Actinacidiphila yanglinensis TaxID=310779 RepID=A0A1H6DPT7_9ACTN|nr:DUF5133 domain-containing protein [Actinacidiphila yanglinensis]SEG87231.1 protein of unknown function [Actinacidiphila yanglinensis]
MIVPDRVVLQLAVEQYLALAAGTVDTELAGLRLHSAAYTLCVLTGTSTAEEALDEVRRLYPDLTWQHTGAREPSVPPDGPDGPDGSDGLDWGTPS